MTNAYSATSSKAKRRVRDWFLMRNDFVVLAPYASINPMEFWILPKKHSANILNLTAPEINAFAKTLKTSLKALKDHSKRPSLQLRHPPIPKPRSPRQLPLAPRSLPQTGNMGWLRKKHRNLHQHSHSRNSRRKPKKSNEPTFGKTLKPKLRLPTIQPQRLSKTKLESFLVIISKNRSPQPFQFNMCHNHNQKTLHTLNANK